MLSSVKKYDVTKTESQLEVDKKAMQDQINELRDENKQQ